MKAGFVLRFSCTRETTGNCDMSIPNLNIIKHNLYSLFPIYVNMYKTKIVSQAQY